MQSAPMNEKGRVVVVLGTTFTLGVVTGFLLNTYTRRVSDNVVGGRHPWCCAVLQCIFVHMHDMQYMQMAYDVDMLPATGVMLYMSR